MKDRRDFLKKLGFGVGAGAFTMVLPQLEASNAETPVVERFQPGPDLLDRNMIYEFRTGEHVGGMWITANPRDEYRPYLVDLWASNGSHKMLNALVDKSLELAMAQDTRGWDVYKWNEELLDAHELAAAAEHMDSLKVADTVNGRLGHMGIRDTGRKNEQGLPIRETYRVPEFKTFHK